MSRFILNFQVDQKIQIIEGQSAATSIDEIVEDSFAFFPNPVDGQLTITWDEMSFKASTLSMVSSNGQVILIQNLGSAQETMKIDCSYLAEGMYMIIMENENERSTKRLIIQH